MGYVERSKRLTVGEVFVAGGFPTITYNPRIRHGLEQHVREYLAERHRILSISGATKTGKTVLVRSVLRDQDAIWLSGGAIRDASHLWSTVADELHLSTSIDYSRQSSETDARSLGAEIALGVGKLAKSGQTATSESHTDRIGRTRPIEAAARKGMRASLQPLVIDDFHYIPASVQLDIIRGIKDLVFDGVPVIFITAPHRASDAIRAEKAAQKRK
jgi:hypothetical protein